MNILNLPRFKVLEVQESDHDYHIVAEHIPVPQCCPNCGVANPTLKRHGKRDRLFMDLPIHAKRVGILVRRQRYECKECSSTFIESLPDMDVKRLMTKRLVAYIERESLKRTFVSIAEQVGIDEGTVRNIFQDYIKRLENEFQFETPEWMGLDEVKLVGRPRCIITNLKERTVVDLLKSRKKKIVANYLFRLPNRGSVEWVCMDMWRPYYDAVQSVLPQARIVIDKFHVVRMANTALDTVRKDTRAGLTPKQRRTLMHDRFILLRRGSELKPEQCLILQAWTKNFPLLGIAYDLKEEVFAIYAAGDRKDALKRYQEWRAKVPDELEPAFHDMLTALENWEGEIFAYFDAPAQITNAYTEAMNGIAKMISRVGRGYSFDAIRAKLLFNGRFHVTRPVYRRKWPRIQETPPVMTRFLLEQPPEEKTELNYGASIATLIEVFESDEV